MNVLYTLVHLTQILYESEVLGSRLSDWQEQGVPE